MEIIPIASESLGVRSMAMLVRTGDCKILIDPGVALGPKRFGLPPHRLEQDRLAELWKCVLASAKDADVMTISHYHYDHHDPERPGMFKGKILLLKHPTENINMSQKERASKFLKAIDGLPSAVEQADGEVFEFGNTSLEFSKAVPHGTNTRLGYVVELAIREGEQTFLHTSDVQGPSLDEQLGFILQSQPGVVACDGPMTYMMYRYGRKALERSLANLVRIIEETPMKTLMLDHHLLREKNWKAKMRPVFDAGEEHGCKVTTFAGYLGKEDDLLEALRKELWEEEG
ncbi:MAG: MBL fold metallo-hydrolase [Thermoplasmata archaeon]|nr:MBL fold metallo-hydrolase [Thermoplasmata archaeon]